MLTGPIPEYDVWVTHGCLPSMSLNRYTMKSVTWSKLTDRPRQEAALVSACWALPNMSPPVTDNHPQLTYNPKNRQEKHIHVHLLSLSRIHTHALTHTCWVCDSCEDSYSFSANWPYFYGARFQIKERHCLLAACVQSSEIAAGNKQKMK